MVRLYQPQQDLELHTPSEVPTKVRIVEEPLAPEGIKGEEEARGLSPLHPNSFQLAVRFLENQSPSFALPRAPSFPSHLRLPQTCSEAFLGSQRSTCQKAAFSSPNRMSFLQYSPSDRWAPYHPSMPEPPHRSQGSPQGRFPSLGLVFALTLARPRILKGSGTLLELKVKTLGRCHQGLSPPPGAGCGRSAWRPPSLQLLGQEYSSRRGEGEEGGQSKTC